MSTEAERTAARELLARHVFVAVKAAMFESPQPQLVLAAAPMVMAGIAGSYVLQLLQTRVLGDGEVDAVLNLMAQTIREHADPQLNETQEPVQLSDHARALLRKVFGGG